MIKNEHIAIKYIKRDYKDSIVRIYKQQNPIHIITLSKQITTLGLVNKIK